MLEYNEDKDGEVEVESNYFETPIHATTWENINDLLEDVYEVDDDIIPPPKNKPRATENSDRTVYKYGRKWNGI